MDQRRSRSFQQGTAGSRPPEPAGVPVQPDPGVLADLEAVFATDGPIRFSKFMDMALYGPHGYYTRRVHIGRAGDFVTAASAPGFAFALARWIERKWVEMDRPLTLQVVEIGAGEGLLAERLIEHLARWRDGLERAAPEVHYVILEVSEALTVRQRERLSGSPIPVHWGDPDARLDSIIIGNEVLDALPVERVRKAADGTWWCAYVAPVRSGEMGTTLAHGAAGERIDSVMGARARDAGETFIASGEPGSTLSPLRVVWQPAPPEFAALCEAWLPIPAGSEAELCLLYEDWFRAVRGYGRRLRALWLDYGITTAEWSAGARPHGTVRGYARHRHVDPLAAAGACDITADVHWDWAMEAARRAGWQVRSCQAQGPFLLAHGILDTVAPGMLPEADRLKLVGGVKTLILPGGMGERYTVLELAAGDPV
jgi:NADH dehydrogenase [ubiquinone] 1 alpha subcomplex assembly factor 7